MRKEKAPTSAAAADRAAAGRRDPEAATAIKLSTESAGADEASDD